MIRHNLYPYVPRKQAALPSKQMRGYARSLLFVSTCLFALPVFAHTYYDQHAVGWHWYDDPKPVVHPIVPLPSKPIPSDPIAQIRTTQRTLERALDSAILDPSPNRIQTYLTLQNQLSQRASRFAAVWQWVLLHHPELNLSLHYPTESLALDVQKKHQQERYDEKIKGLAEHTGLFFFYKPSCPYCVRFAPIVKNIAAHYRIPVIPITLENAVLPEFPDSKKDQGQARQLGVKQTPALFAVNPKNKQAFPVAYGLISETSLRERLADSASFFFQPEEPLP